MIIENVLEQELIIAEQSPEGSAQSLHPPTPTSPCKLCSLAHAHIHDTDDENKAALHAIFHGPCSSCEQAERCHGSQNLCSSCRHLRLRHLVNECGGSSIRQSANDEESEGSRFIEVELGPIANQKLGCILCRIFASALRQELQLYYGLSADDPIFKNSVSLLISCYDFQPLNLDYYSGETAAQPENLKKITNLILCIRGDQLSRSFACHISCGKHIERVEVTPLVQWDTLRVWLSHASTVEPVRRVNELRLVDIDSLSVVSAAEFCEYAALSYVWGEAGSHCAGESVMEKGYVASGALSPGSLPATIADAITACRKLGIRYLWIDALCILQNDPAHKTNQINQMDRIYRGAALCIIAAAGKDATYGLPGVESLQRRNWRSQHASFLDFEVAGLISAFNNHIENTTWSSRGWTYQEFMLSDRILFFTEGGALFFDRRSKDIEIFTEYQHPKLFQIHSNDIEKSYGYIIEQYTKRKLSFEEDIVNAVSGVLNHCLSGGHSYGMAHEYFDCAILWDTYNEENSWRPSTPTTRYPTWSWASAYGDVIINDGGHAVAYWAAVNSDAGDGEEEGLTFMIPRQLRLEEREVRYSQYGYSAPENSLKARNVAAGLAWVHGCLETPAPGVIASFHDRPANDYRDDLENLWSSTFDYWSTAFGHCLYSPASLPSSGLFHAFSVSDIALASAVPGRILVRAQEVTFNAGPQIVSHYPNPTVDLGYHIFISNAFGLTVGALRFGARLAAKLGNSWHGRVRLIGLSVARAPSTGTVPPHWMSYLQRSGSDWGGPPLAFSNRRGESIEETHFVMNVMAVAMLASNGEEMYINSEGDERLARRIAVGEVYLRQWVLAERQFKTLVLE